MGDYEKLDAKELQVERDRLEAEAATIRDELGQVNKALAVHEYAEIEVAAKEAEAARADARADDEAATGVHILGG